MMAMMARLALRYPRSFNGRYQMAHSTYRDTYNKQITKLSLLYWIPGCPLTALNPKHAHWEKSYLRHAKHGSAVYDHARGKQARGSRVCELVVP